MPGTEQQSVSTNLESVRLAMITEGDLQQATNRLVAIVRRVEREGFGRNEHATREGIDRYIAKGNDAVRKLCDSDAYQEARYDHLIERFWTIERRALDVTR